MPPRLMPVTAATVAERIALRPDTISLAAAKAIFVEMAEHAAKDRYWELQTCSLNLATQLQGLISDPMPDTLTGSARTIRYADDFVSVAKDIRFLAAAVYDRFHTRTRSATEALEILTAWSVQLETADEDLRCGALAA